MRRFLSVLVIVFAAAAGGCPKPAPPPPKNTPKAAVAVRPEKGFRKKPTAPATPEQEAIFTILDAEAAAFKDATQGLQPDSQPSAVSKAVLKYVDALDKIDATPAPSPFGAAFGKYRLAVRALQESLSRLPDAYTGAQFGDMMKALFRGDSATGKALGGDVMNSVREVADAFEAMYTATLPYGFDVDR